MEIDPFLYYFVITKTLNLSNMKYKLTYLNQYLQKKTKALCDQDIHTLQYERK